MLAQDAYELVDRCYENTSYLIDKEGFKQLFIEYVFTNYQEEVVANVGLDKFFKHLDDLQLSHCRKDFDIVVEKWYENQTSFKQHNYHESLFTFVKEVVSTQKPKNKVVLVQELTIFLTSSEGLMKRWKGEKNKSNAMYFKHLDSLGIHSIRDIEALVDVWLIEHPNSFEPHQQALFAKQNRRGRPNNAELYLLLEKVWEIKPELTKLEKERLRKIYYYYRKTLTTLGMLEKFTAYISTKSNKKASQKPKKNDSTQVG